MLGGKLEIGHGEILQEISEDAIAWLTVDGTLIDYPVMQGSNNDEYLNKDPFENSRCPALSF